MSRCTRLAQLEAVVEERTPAAVRHELEAHAQTCAVCRHELRWLESERSLFRQRAGHEEVARLWAGVEAQAKPPPPARSARVLAGLAAALALAVGVPRVLPHPAALPVHADAAGFTADDEGALMSEALESTGWGLPGGDETRCSTLPRGWGLHCAAPIPASFGALWVQR